MRKHWDPLRFVLVGSLVLSSAFADATFDQDGSANIVCSCKAGEGAPELLKGEWREWVRTIKVHKGMKLDDLALAEACYRDRASNNDYCAEGKTLADSLQFYKGKKQE